MKRTFGKLFVTWLLVAACLMGSALAEVIDMMPLISTQGGGVVETVGEWLRIAGRKPDGSGDDYLNTWHILDQQVSDFDWSFTYTPSRVEWNQDRFFFRSVDENEWNGYCLFVGGFGVPENMRGLHLYKGEAYDSPIASLDYEVEEGVTYAVRILAEGTT